MIDRVVCRQGWTDRDGWADVLVQAGLSRSAAETKAQLLADAAQAMADRLPDRSASALTAFFVPGRIEVLGKHTDYAGGRTIVTAVERGFCLVTAPRPDSLIRVTDMARERSAWFKKVSGTVAGTARRVLCTTVPDTFLNHAERSVQFPLSPDLVPVVGDWSNYPMTVARRIARNFPGAGRGAEIVFSSDLPEAAGMSSSSAMMVAMFLALAEVNGLWTRPEMRDHLTDRVELAGYLATVENGQTFRGLEGDLGVGTFGGSEDHTAILCCRPNMLSEYSYCPLRFRRWLPLPSGYTFAIGSSGVAAEKTGAAMEKYNRASRLARMAAGLWRRETNREEPHLAAILDSSADSADRLRRILETARLDGASVTRDDLLQRFEHFRQEHGEFLPAASDALLRGDVEGFGRSVDQSQRGAEQLLGNQIAETSYLAATAREHGAVAASAFGAGFGGSVWAMIQTERLASFLHSWADAYRSRFPEHASNCRFFVTAAGPSAFQLSRLS